MLMYAFAILTNDDQLQVNVFYLDAVQARLNLNFSDIDMIEIIYVVVDIVF